MGEGAAPRASRRDLLRSGLAIGAGAALAGCAQVARRLPGRDLPDNLQLPEVPASRETRLANRAGFGPTPGQVREMSEMGLHAWLEQQLAAEQPEDLRLKAQLLRLDVLRIDGIELRDIPEDVMVRQLNQAALLRATYSPNQLYERMVDFWGNHFNIYARKGLAAYRKARDEREVVRRHTLGSFPEMLRASARSPAMLAYLDNQFNRKQAPNENYARELMELHTLGVHGGYSQDDVREVARCFTGWGIEKRFLRAKGTFLFQPEHHDPGEKVVLGHRIPAGGGIEDGERVLDILAHHPQTARFIAGKLCRHFLGDSESPVRARLERVYLSTQGDIRSMLRELFTSNELLEGPPVAKRPFDFVVSALRAVGAQSDCGPRLQAHLANMGQSLYEWPMPDGYPDGAQPWTGSLLARWNFALALCSGRIEGTDASLEALAARTGESNTARAMAALVLNRTDGPTVASLQRRNPTDVSVTAAMLLASPEFQWR